MSRQFTQKAVEALKEAQNLAKSNRHGVIFPVHLAVAIFSDPEGLGKRVCQKAGAGYLEIERALRRKMSTLSQVSPVPDEV